MILENEKKEHIKMDFSLKTPQERCAKVKEIIENTPSERLTPVYLEKLADYMIFAIGKQERELKKQQYNIVTANKLVTINKRETSFEGLVGTFLSLPLFSIKNLRDEEVKKIFNYEFIKSYSIIICIIICSILCGFKSIYQKKTLIQYSPNTRAFAEGIWDPGFIIYSKFCIKRSDNLFRFIMILILSIIIDFCACVYNEFLVLYCCGMEYETFIEVNKRNIITKIENDTIGETFSKTITNEEEKENENENEDNMFY